jgi:hypothetical protein
MGWLDWKSGFLVATVPYPLRVSTSTGFVIHA